MSRVASLGMYDFPWLHQANDALWRELRAHLAAAGIDDPPAALDRDRPLGAIWNDPSLLLAQTCGYPLVADLAGRVRLVATPVYDFPGCDGARHRSFIVTRADDGRTLAGLRGGRCAFNNFDSNSGMNLSRAAFAPLARGQPFFSEVIETGAHLRSLEAIREGRADVAAIDCVTHGFVARDRPDLLAGTRVLAMTAVTPGLPLICAPATGAAELAAIRGALAAAVGGAACASLRIVGFATLDEAAYMPVSALAARAAEAGYPVLA